MFRKLTMLALFVCAFCWATAAQDQPKVPKLLILEREEIKPGKVTAHTQAANRFVQIAEKNQAGVYRVGGRSEEHTSELQSLAYLVCRLLLEKKKNYTNSVVSVRTFYDTVLRVDY